MPFNDSAHNEELFIMTKAPNTKKSQSEKKKIGWDFCAMIVVGYTVHSALRRVMRSRVILSQKYHPPNQSNGVVVLQMVVYALLV